MRKTNRVIYFVEGECEAKLINALKEIPAAIRPGHLPAVHWVEQDCPLQQLAQLPRRGVQYGRLPLCLLELLAGLQQNLGAVSLLSCLPGLAFDAQGQRTGHQAGYQHDGEGQWIARGSSPRRRGGM